MLAGGSKACSRDIDSSDGFLHLLNVLNSSCRSPFGVIAYSHVCHHPPLCPASATPTPTPMEVAVPAPIVTSHIESPVHRNLSPTFDVVVEETGEALSSDLNPQSGENGKYQGQSSIGGSPNKEPETCSQSGKRGPHVAVLEVIGNEAARPQRKRRAKEVEKLGAAPRKSPRKQAVEVEDSEEVVTTKTSARVSLDAGCSIPKALCDPF